MLVAEAAFAAIQALPEPIEAEAAAEGAEGAEEEEEAMPPPFTGPVADLSAYEAALEASWVYEELRAVRNMRPAAHAGLGMWGAFLYAGVVHYLTRGREPFTLTHGGADWQRLKPARYLVITPSAEAQPARYLVITPRAEAPTGASSGCVQP